MKLNESPFERIKNGTKTIEFRLYDEKRQQIKVEDKIEFSTDIKNIENIIKVIKEIHPYEEPVINIIPLLNDKFDINLNY